MAKIENQYFVKDQFRDLKHTFTVKCACCEEESNLSIEFPFPMKVMVGFLNDFQKLHKGKDCNKNQMDIPEWAGKSVNIAISM